MGGAGRDSAGWFCDSPALIERDVASGHTLSDAFTERGAHGGGEVQRALLGAHGQEDEPFGMRVEQALGEPGGFLSEHDGVARTQIGAPDGYVRAGGEQPERPAAQRGEIEAGRRGVP